MVDKLRQISDAHESVSYLLHQLGHALIIAIAARAAKLAPRSIVEFAYKNPRIQVSGISKPAKLYAVDLVFLIRTGAGEREVWIFEVQDCFDATKFRRWGLYELAFENEFDAAGFLAVFTPKPGLRRDIREKLLPRCKTKPILVEPDQIERITDYEDARARPELAILGALFHAQPPASFEAQVEVFRAAWIAIQTVAEPDALRYGVAVMELIEERVVEQGIEELREAGEFDEERAAACYEYHRDGYAIQKALDEGREQGLQQGLERGRELERVELLRRIVVETLELRGFTVDDEQRRRVASCESADTLERWYAAVKTAAANQPVAAILGPDH